MIGILSVTRWNSSSVTDRQQLAATLRAQRYRRGRGGRKGGEDRGRGGKEGGEVRREGRIEGGRGGRKRPQVVLMSLIYYILEYLKRKSPDIVVQR